LSAVVLTRLTTAQAMLFLFGMATLLVVLANKIGIVGRRWRARRFVAVKEKVEGRGVSS
jgi:hypothetical protein